MIPLFMKVCVTSAFIGFTMLLTGAVWMSATDNPGSRLVTLVFVLGGVIVIVSIFLMVVRVLYEMWAS